MGEPERPGKFTLIDMGVRAAFVLAACTAFLIGERLIGIPVGCCCAVVTDLALFILVMSVLHARRDEPRDPPPDG